MQELISWICRHAVEICGALSGLLYIFLTIKTSVWLWPVGILMAILYMLVYMEAGVYAYMGLQLYYLAISIYGWYHWLDRRKNVDTPESNELPITHISLMQLFALLIISALLTFAIAFFLDRYTDSDIPWLDGFTTALSITATWMLARKIIEHWLFWIVVDSVVCGISLVKQLYPTIVLFAVYTILAAYGYLSWLNKYKKQAESVKL
jgi:nicotinamide mononucleotide transporter